MTWEPSFCFKNPIALGYTRGHFTALVPLERNEINFTSNSFVAKSNSDQGGGAVCHLDHSDNQQQVFYLPLTNSDGQLLPVHFLTCAEVSG